MGTTKKPKKKYKPRTVYFPKILNTMFAFAPLEEGLNKLLNHGEILQDDFDNYVYLNSCNEEESFTAGLEVYTRIVGLLCEARSLQLDLTPALVLRDEMEAKEGFDEETILNAKVCLENCKQVIATSDTLLVRKFTMQVGVERDQERKQEEKGE